MYKAPEEGMALVEKIFASANEIKTFAKSPGGINIFQHKDKGKGIKFSFFKSPEILKVDYHHHDQLKQKEDRKPEVKKGS